MAANGISTETVGDPVDPIATKIKRREDKLALAATKRATVGIAYRPYHTISGTFDAYVMGTLQTLAGTNSPEDHHPWS